MLMFQNHQMISIKTHLGYLLNMSNNLELINIDSDLSKNILNSIIQKEKIEFKKLKILKLKKQIESIRAEYLLKKKYKRKKLYKYQTFGTCKKKFSDTEIIFKKRDQKERKKSSCFFSDVNSFRFLPIVIVFLIFQRKLKTRKINELTKN